MSLSEVLLGGMSAVTGITGGILGYKTASRANRISDKTADGAAYERAVKLYDKIIELQAQELEAARSKGVVVEARLDLIEADLSNTKQDLSGTKQELSAARQRITDLEDYILHQGLPVPPDGPNANGR